MYGFIYKTTNNVNGKMYIGKRTYDKDGKWETYLGSGTLLKRALKKYGKDNFSRTILQECEDLSELNSSEKYWIDYYDATKNDMFYNISGGGDGGNTIAGYTEEQLIDYKARKSEIHKITSPKGENSGNAVLKEKDVKEIIQMMLDGEYDIEISKNYNVSHNTISDIRNHKTWKFLTHGIEFPTQQKRYEGKNKKVVCQYDECGTYLNTFNSAVEAENITGVPKKLISAVCHGGKRAAYGYIWRFSGDDFNKYPVDDRRFRTAC